ncbi:hypothetical protein T4E_7545 [Trichinella pseudospiralis]|nr:hypothetical protein T4E_7545 [Trichinella pseudospiralis]KRY00971.1 hypothetical protein T4E_7545 [Trichinella pseudospiralis]KRY00973.1 hypothetical protein T4E_7545 [Trichinella pseudospiralis]
MGAFMVARVLRSIQHMVVLGVHSIICWCGSEIAHTWSPSSAHLSTHRVAKIQHLVEHAACRHCPEWQNLLTLSDVRAITLFKLVEKLLRRHGLKWLACAHNAWHFRVSANGRSGLKNEK